jgi:hypothetical protein
MLNVRTFRWLSRRLGRLWIEDLAWRFRRRVGYLRRWLLEWVRVGVGAFLGRLPACVLEGAKQVGAVGMTGAAGGYVSR